MTASDVVRTLLAAGCRLLVNGENLRVQSASDALTDDMRQAIRERKPEIIRLLTQPREPVPSEPPEPKLEPPTYIKRCPACGGTNWGQTGSLQGGFERWGCLDCPPAPDSAHSPECPMCGGAYLITDQAGKFCTDCRCRPWEKRESEPVPKPEPLAVRWGSAQGWLRLMNPLTSEIMEIPARGAPKWLFDRLSEQKRSPVRFEKRVQQPMPAVVEKPIVPPTSETEAFWRDDDDIPF